MTKQFTKGIIIARLTHGFMPMFFKRGQAMIVFTPQKQIIRVDSFTPPSRISILEIPAIERDSRTQ